MAGGELCRWGDYGCFESWQNTPKHVFLYIRPEATISCFRLMVNCTIGNVDAVTDRTEYKAANVSTREGGLHDVCSSLVQRSRAPNPCSGRGQHGRRGEDGEISRKGTRDLSKNASFTTAKGRGNPGVVQLRNKSAFKSLLTSLHAVRKKLNMASWDRHFGHCQNIPPVCVSAGLCVSTACRKYLTQYKAMEIRKFCLFDRCKLDMAHTCLD